MLDEIWSSNTFFPHYLLYVQELTAMQISDLGISNMLDLV